MSVLSKFARCHPDRVRYGGSPEMLAKFFDRLRCPNCSRREIVPPEIESFPQTVALSKTSCASCGECGCWPCLVREQYGKPFDRIYVVPSQIPDPPEADVFKAPTQLCDWAIYCLGETDAVHKLFLGIYNIKGRDKFVEIVRLVWQLAFYNRVLPENRSPGGLFIKIMKSAPPFFPLLYQLYRAFFLGNLDEGDLIETEET
jgi:hypothetical protein